MSPSPLSAFSCRSLKTPLPPSNQSNQAAHPAPVWQVQGKTGGARGSIGLTRYHAFHVQESAQYLGHDLVRDVQPQAGVAAVAAGGEEGFEDARAGTG